jgi:hypothetical protein
MNNAEIKLLDYLFGTGKKPSEAELNEIFTDEQKKRDGEDQ